MNSKRLRLLLPAKPESLISIRKEVQSLIVGTAYEERAGDILVVVSEACTNVVRHAYCNTHECQTVQVEAVLRPGQLTVMIADEGKGIEDAGNSPVFTEEGGFGLYLMQRLSDSFKCYTSQSGTVVELVFKNPSTIKSGQDVHSSVMLDFARTLRDSVADAAAAPRLSPATGGRIGRIGRATLAHDIRSLVKVASMALYVRSRIQSMEKALAQGDYDSATRFAREINERLQSTQKEFLGITPRSVLLLQRYLQEAQSTVSQTRKRLAGMHDGVQERMPKTPGIYGSVRKSELMDSLAETLDRLTALISEGNRCWIALGEEPSRLI